MIPYFTVPTCPDVRPLARVVDPLRTLVLALHSGAELERLLQGLVYRILIPATCQALFCVYSVSFAAEFRPFF